MGNSQVKDDFKVYDKGHWLDSTEKVPLPFSGRDLFEDKTMENYYKFVWENLKQPFESAEIFKKFDVQMKQENNKTVSGSHFQQEFLRELQNNYTAGFTTSETNVVMLRDATFQKYFTVYTHEEQKTYTQMQLFKYYALYGLYVEKFEGKEKDETFFEFIDKFLKADCGSSEERVLFGLQTGLSFSISLLKEMEKISPKMVKTSLTYLFSTLVETDPGAIYAQDKAAFMNDSTIGEAREFLVSLVENKSTQDEVLILCYKLILRMGLVRSCPEDYLVVNELLQKHPEHAKKVDLRDELSAICAGSGSGSVSNSNEDQENSNTSTQFKWDTIGVLNCLPMNMAPYDAPIQNADGLVTDGRYFYWKCEQGLLQTTIGDFNSLSFKIVAKKTGLGWENASMLCFDDKLFIRHKGTGREKAFIVLDPKNMKEIEDFEIKIDDPESADRSEDNDKEEVVKPITLLWDESADKKTGRLLSNSPFVTDGFFFYVISQKKDVSTEHSDDEDEKQQTKLVVECFDPSTPEFKFVKSVTLFKNAQKDPFVKSDNSQDSLLNYHCATNGTYFLLQEHGQQKTHIFDLSSGVRVSKSSLPEEGTQLRYDPRKGVFYNFQPNSEKNSTCALITSKAFEPSSGVQSKGDEEQSSQNNSSLSGFNQIRDAYLKSKKSEPQNSLNVVQRIMKVQYDAHRTVQNEPESLPKNSLSLVQAILLNSISAKCKTCENELVLQLDPSQEGDRKNHLIKFFKFDSATFLTGDMFQSLHQTISRLSKELVQCKKTVENFADQLSLQYAMQILGTNLTALGFCRINLTDMLEPEQYKEFLDMYQKSIVSIIEKGYMEDYEQSAQTEDMKQCWQLIYSGCQKIMANSMDLIYSETSAIIETLDKTLHSMNSPKEAEIASFSLQYISQARNCQKLLTGDETKLNCLKSMTTRCADIRLQDLLKRLSATKPFADPESVDTSPEHSLLIHACSDFMTAFASHLLFEYSNKAQLVEKRKKKATKEERDQLFALEDFVTHIFECRSQGIGKCLDKVRNLLTEVVKEKDKDFWNGDAKTKFSEYDNALFQLFTESVMGINAFFNAFLLLCDRTRLMSRISQTAITLVKDISQYLELRQKTYALQLGGKLADRAEDASDSEDNEDESGETSFTHQMSTLQRSISYILGQFAYQLILVKTQPEEVKADEDADPKKTKQKQMEKKIMSSKILSGGFENRHLNLFSKKTIDEMACISDISGDNNMSECIKQVLTTLSQSDKPKQETEAEYDEINDNEDEQMLHQIIYEGRNPNVDLFVKVLQEHLIGKRPMVRHARLGGADGMRMSRAAFATMIKFSSKVTDFVCMVDEVEFFADELDPSMQEKKRMDELKKYAKAELQGFDDVFSYWEKASLMRSWIINKKQNLINKIEQDQTNEFLSQKKAEMKKQKEIRAKAKEEAEKAKEKANGGPEDKAKPEGEQVIDTSEPAKSDKNKKDKGGKEKDKGGKEKDKDGKDKDEKDEAKDADDDKDEDVKLTEEENTKIKQNSEKIFDKQIADIFNLIIKKANLASKMTTHSHYKFEDAKKLESSQLRMIKAPTFYEAAKKEGMEIDQTEIDAEEGQSKDWTERLKNWRQMQTSAGTIKNFSDLQKQATDSGISAVLAYLQSPVTAESIKKHFESVLLNASRRSAGLNLISQIINTYQSSQTRSDLVSWFCAALRENSNTMRHYLHNVEGCGLHFETQLANKFFEIFSSILGRIKVTKKKEEAMSLLNALKWKFLGRDHRRLLDLNIFTALREGNGHRKNMLRRSWGKFMERVQRTTDDGPNDFIRELVSTFEHFYLLLVGRIVDSDLGQAMVLKTAGTNVPKMERSKSIVDVNVSEKLLQQAFEVLFKEVDRYVKILRLHQGVDWSTYVQQRNLARKEERSLEKHTDVLLLDEEIEEEEHKKAKAAAKKKREKEKEEKEAAEAAAAEKDKENEPEADKDKETEPAEKEDQEKVEGEAAPAEEPTEVETAAEGEVTVVADEKAEKSEKGSDKGEKSEKGSQKDEDEEKGSDKNSEAGDGENEEDNKENEHLESAKEKLQSKVAKEMKNMYKMYSDEFLRRLLRMIDIFTSVTLTTEYPRAMVQRVANPFMISSLLNLMTIASPRAKLIVIRIIKSLVAIGIPTEVFAKAGERVKNDKECAGNVTFREVSYSPALDSCFADSPFLDYFFRYMLHIRQCMWAKKLLQSQGAYELSQEIAHLFLTIQANTAGDKTQLGWKKAITSLQKTGYKIIEKLPVAEQDVLLSMLIGADFKRISTGDSAITSQQQKITVLGYSAFQMEINDSEATKVYDQHLTQHFQSDSQSLIGLFYDQQAKDRQEIIVCPAYDVKPIVDLDSDKTAEMAKLSPLMDEEIVTHLLDVVMNTKEDSSGSQSAGSIAGLNLKAAIMKAISFMIEILNKEFFSLLRSQNMLEKFVHFIAAESVSIKDSSEKEGSIIPTTWLESKVSNMRAVAIESDAKITAETEMTCQVFDKKQLLFKRVDPLTSDLIAQNALLLSAISIYQVNENTRFVCHLSPSEMHHRLPKSQQKNGLVFVEGSQLETLDDDVCEIMQSSRAILSHSINIKEFFGKMIEKVKKSVEEDEEDEDKKDKEKKKDRSDILKCIIFIVSKDDFDDVKNSCGPDAEPMVKEGDRIDEKLSEIEFFFQSMEKWGGIDTQKVLWHLCQLDDKSVKNVKSQFLKVLEEVNEEDKQYEERIKQLEGAGNTQQLGQEKTKRTELLEKRTKEIAEKKHLLFQEKKTIGLVEQLASEALAKGEPDLPEKMDIYSILGDKKENIEKYLDPVVDNQIATSDPQEAESGDSAKSEEQQRKLYYKEINKFTSTQIARDYRTSMQKLCVSYCQSSLERVLSDADLETVMPILLKDLGTQKQLACFIKNNFCKAVNTRVSTGQKDELKLQKKMLRRLFEFCLSGKCEDQQKAESFVHRFLAIDIIASGQQTIKELLDKKSDAPSKLFTSEEQNIKLCAPDLLKFTISLMLENRAKWLLTHTGYLPNLFSLLTCMIVKFHNTSKESKVITRLLHACLHIIFYCREYLEEFAQNGILEGVVNNDLLTRIAKKIDFERKDEDNKRFSEQQRLILEVYLGCISLVTETEKLGILNFDPKLEITKGISIAKRGLQIIKEQDKFTFLPYHVHHESLKDHDKALLNQTYECQHPPFNAKTCGKFQIDQVERLTIKLKEKCDFKPLAFLGIANNQDGKDMELYTKADVKVNEGKLDFNMSHFYTFYPVVKQMVVAFGEEKNKRTGLDKTADEPTLVMETKQMKAKQIFSHKNHTILIDDKDMLQSTGSGWGSDHSNFTQMKFGKDEEKVQKIICGPKQRFILTTENKVYFTGISKDFCLPEDRSVSSFTLFKLSQDPLFTDKIVDIACGKYFNVFVTESGKIFCTGNRLLKKFGMESEVPLVLPVKDDAKVLRAWASSATQNQELVIIEVQLKDGEMQLWSAGKSEQGLLGQGGKTKETKVFAPLNYDHKAVKFSEVSVHTDHAMAIDQNGEVWSWGSNLQYRAGLSHEVLDGVYSPTKLTYFGENNLKVIKISCGFDHSLILAEDKDKKRHFFSVGKEETNWKHLGTTSSDASDSIFHEIISLQGFEIVDFSAASKYSMVIIGGEQKADDGLYEHILPDGTKTSGILHFYKKGGAWNFLNKDQYLEAKKANTLPPVCFAMKCGIKDMVDTLENIPLFRDSEQTFENILEESGDHGIKSSLSKKDITGARYYSTSRINGSEQRVNLTELEQLKGSNIFDVNPLIYYRLERPLKASAPKLPSIDLKLIFGEMQKYGFSIEVMPDSSFIHNDKLVELTKESYNELTAALAKYPEGEDKELIAAMNSQMKGVDKEIKNVEVEKDFDVSAMKFKSEKLKKASEHIKKQRTKLLWGFNKMFVDMNCYLVSEPVKPFRGMRTANFSAANLFNEVKHMVLTTVKMKFVNSAIANLPTGERVDITLNRLEAAAFRESGKVDHTGEYTIFGQAHRQLKPKCEAGGWMPFKQNSTDDSVYWSRFVGENSIDIGGPYRETLSNMVYELEQGALPLLVKTTNNRTDHGDCRECYSLDATSKNPTHANLFHFLGLWMGYAFRSTSCIPYNMNPVFWKQLNNTPLVEDDLKSFDTYSWQIIRDLRNHVTKLTDDEWNSTIEQNFTTVLNNQQEVQLCDGGKEKLVTKENVEEFVKLLLKTRFEEGEQQLNWIKDGVYTVIPRHILNMLSWEEIEVRAAGEKILDVEALKRITRYSRCNADHRIVKMFWKVLEDYSDEDKSAYLKFVWGRQRLPANLTNLEYTHKVTFDQWADKGDLPKSHTCFFQIDFPDYQDEETMATKLRIAIQFCGEIDDD